MSTTGFRGSASAVVAMLVTSLAGCAPQTARTPHGTARPPMPWGNFDVAGAPAAYLRVHTLNVGAGSCQVVECPSSVPLVFDCGSSGGTTTDMGEADAAAYLQAIFARSGRPRVVISHPDADHSVWIPAVMQGWLASSIWLGGRQEQYPEAVQTWMGRQQAQYVPINVGFPAGASNSGRPLQDLACGNGTYMLTVNVGSTKNDSSLMMRVVYGSFSAIFSGDATGVTQESAVSNYPQGLLTTLVTGSHHGAWTMGSNSPAWAQATQPQLLIFSAGTKYWHPRCEAANAYGAWLGQGSAHPFMCGTGGAYVTSAPTANAYDTEVDGTIVVTSDGSAVQVALGGTGAPAR